MKIWKDFGGNELILLLMIVTAYLVYFLLIRRPDRLAKQITVLSLLWGMAIGILYDFTIGGGRTDFYKVNDLNNYEVTDVLYYLLFAPFGYFFFYLYEKLNISKKTFIIYVLAWALLGVFIQWVLTAADIIFLQKEYKLMHSFPIFLLTQTLTGIYIQVLKSKESLTAE
ncbi:putative Acylphosphate phosphohydrolase [Bacillus sp. ZZV12-4809]|nr:putative Acylphosphate phosphohydrolase [Bacillus sp. ZZV12-4809]